MGDFSKPTAVVLIERLVVYLLLGYEQADQRSFAQEICLKLGGLELSDLTFDEIANEISRGDIDMVEEVRQQAKHINVEGTQQVLQAVFLTVHSCCDIQYEDRLRINLIGNALGVGLEFVEYAISKTREAGYYGVRRLTHSEAV